MRYKRGHQHHHMVCHLGSLVLMWSVISVVCHGLGAWSVISVVCHGSGAWPVTSVVCHGLGAWSVISMVCHGSGGVVCHRCGLSWIGGWAFQCVPTTRERRC